VTLLNRADPVDGPAGFGERGPLSGTLVGVSALPHRVQAEPGVDGPPTDVRRARRSVIALFVLMGTTTGSWAARIPGVRDQLQISDARWGLANIGATAGSLVSLIVVMAVVVRTGPKRLALTGGTLLLFTAPLAASSTSVEPLFLQGIATGLLAGPMNAQAVEVERRYGRRIMSSFHACFSLGQLAGGLFGTLASHLGIRPAFQLAGSGVVLGLLLLSTYRGLPPEQRGQRPARSAARRPLRTRFTPQLLLLAVIALLASINEGSAAQWSAQYTANALGAGAAAGAATYTCYTVAMALSRSTGDRLVNRLGQRRFIRLSETLVVLGFGGCLLAGTPLAAAIGFALLGLGSGCVVPSVMGLAGNQPGRPAGEGVAVVSFGQWPAFLVGPPLIGGIAGLVGLRVALFTLVLAAASIVVLSAWIRPSPPAEQAVSRSVGG
jgi:MFS family permease